MNMQNFIFFAHVVLLLGLVIRLSRLGKQIAHDVKSKDESLFVKLGSPNFYFWGIPELKFITSVIVPADKDVWHSETIKKCTKFKCLFLICLFVWPLSFATFSSMV